ncbi:hypothetical protein E4Z66_02090 [Aliishimia ponticola]|uniref:Hedgehog/Intein (Hint) domain-containing protein n=1 Tax=Aliishimia ponticola TaxID=2499833 RepID=A0A4S4NFL2_9RHOB|nr:Hint domain-containing protein [Aliishimia ponticola]THH38382.1 hypothetical protein E4Z66_02090 [Aliishimia ponticola]
MITTTNTMVYIGNFADMDTDETDFDVELRDTVLGTYDAFSDLEVVDITSYDANDDSAIFDDESGNGDYVEYTQGGVFHSSRPDASMLYQARVTDVNGTVHDIEVVLVQMTNGDVFVGDKENLGNFDNLTIRSIELYAPGNHNAYGYYTWQNAENTTVCFCAGTLLRTARGLRDIAALRRGDLVMTLDDGWAVIDWIGGTVLGTPGHNAAIRIGAGALAPGVPRRTLCVSPQHRILIRSRIAERMFGQKEILVAAKRLLGLPSIGQDPPGKPVHYIHLSLLRHHLIEAEGCWSESLFPGEMARKGLPPEIARAAFAETDGTDATPARLIPPGRRVARLLARHRKNALPLVGPDRATHPHL